MQKQIKNTAVANNLVAQGNSILKHKANASQLHHACMNKKLS